MVTDILYGNIDVETIARRITETPQFRRLLHVNQLGGKQHIFAKAKYKRYEHSIGVYHLASRLLEIIINNQPELYISVIDQACIKVAALCHDIGHGPLSHLFEEVVGRINVEGLPWTHEQASTWIVDHLYQNRPEIFHSIEFTQRDIDFVKSLIVAEPDEVKTGRGKEKSFMYEMISNKRNGMDVDRWDGLARDNKHLELEIADFGFNVEDWIEKLRVIKLKDGSTVISACESTASAIFNLCNTRYKIYEKVYHHKDVRAVELMLIEALTLAAPHLMISGKTIEEHLRDVEAYSTELDDRVFDHIEKSEESGLQKSRELLDKVRQLQLWTVVGEVLLPQEMDKKTILRRLKDLLERETKELYKVDICTRNYGKGENNPLQHISFYKQHESLNKYTLCESTPQVENLPHQFQQTIIRIYCTVSPMPQKAEHFVEQILNKEMNALQLMQKDKL